MLFDDILKSLGEFGKYQRLVYSLAAFADILTGLHNLNIVFILAIPNYRCAIPGFPNDTYAIQDETHASLINATIPSGDSCHIYTSVNGTDNQTTACDRWVYDKSIFTATAVTDFNLVCQRSILKSIAAMTFYIGMLFGGLIGGHLADRFGRKIIVFIMGILMIATSFGMAFSPDVYALMAFRFFAAFFQLACYVSVFVISMEIVGPNKRMLAGILLGGFFALCYVFVTAFAYFLRDWRHMQVGLAVPTVFIILFWWLLPESPRWQLIVGKEEEAEKTIRRAAKVNKVMLPEKLFDSGTVDTAEKTETQSVIKMLKYKVLFGRTAVICFNWGAISMVYYGLTLNSSRLVGNIFVNFLLSGLVEIPATLFAIFTLNPFGRRKVHSFCMVLAGTACLSSIFVTLFADPDLSWILILLQMTGKFGVSAGFSIIYVYTAELNPTSLRTVSVGLGSVCARIFTVAAPYIVDLGDLVGGKFAKDVLPLVVFGVFSITAGLLALLLPETRRRRLPETIEDALHFTRRRKKGRKDFPQENPAFSEDGLEKDGHVISRKSRSEETVEKGLNPAFRPEDDEGAREYSTSL